MIDFISISSSISIAISISISISIVICYFIGMVFYWVIIRLSRNFRLRIKFD